LVAVIVLVARRDPGPGTSSRSEVAGEAGVVGGDLHSLTADPTTPSRIFAGGHQAVAVSSDGGRTWKPVPTLAGADAMGWGFTDGAVFVSGHPGLNRSTDGGASFRRINDGLPDTDVHAFGAGRAVLYGAGPSNGVIASSDGGKSWQSRTGRAGQSFFGRIAVDPTNDDHIFASDVRAGVAESGDGGKTWRLVDTGLRAASWLSASRTFDEFVASGPDGAVISRDGATTWTRLVVPSGASLVEVDPQDRDVLYAGIHDGRAVTVRISRDGGRVWAKP